MPHFTLQFQAGGPQLNLFVGVSQPREQALRQANITIPQPTLVRGLVDTGASITAVDPAVIQALGLQPTGFMPVHTPSTGSTPHQASTFDVSIAIPVAPLTFTLGAIAVIESSLTVQGIQVLIGRDVLAHCLFVYDGRSNIFSLAF